MTERRLRTLLKVQKTGTSWPCQILSQFFDDELFKTPSFPSLCIESTFTSFYLCLNLSKSHIDPLQKIEYIQRIAELLYYCFSILYHALVLLTQNQEDILKSGEMISKTRYAKNNFSDRNEKMFARKGCSASLMSMIELSPGMTRIFHPLLVSFSSPSLFQREVLFRKVLRP